jgi:hypothetical protein
MSNIDYERAALLLHVAEEALKYPKLKALHDGAVTELEAMLVEPVDEQAAKQAAEEQAAAEKAAKAEAEMQARAEANRKAQEEKAKADAAKPAEDPVKPPKEPSGFYNPDPAAQTNGDVPRRSV